MKNCLYSLKIKKIQSKTKEYHIYTLYQSKNVHIVNIYKIYYIYMHFWFSKSCPEYIERGTPKQLWGK